MKDLHNHLLYGIDDGSNSIEESLKLVKLLRKQGITEIIITPHYVYDSEYTANNRKKNKIFKELKERLKEENIDVELYLGNEVFFTSNMYELIKNKEVNTLNNSKYLLFEFPMNNIYQSSSEILSDLMSKGIVPILAHPERYKKFQDNPDLVVDYLRMGLLLQGNCTSLFGKYGRKAEKTLKYFIKRGWISFVGTDTHHDVKFSGKKLKRKLLKLNKDKDYIEDILENNFDKVVNDEFIGMLR